MFRLLMLGGRLVGWKDNDGIHRIATMAECPMVRKTADGQIKLSGGSPEILDTLIKGLEGKSSITDITPLEVSDASKDKKSKVRVQSDS